MPKVNRHKARFRAIRLNKSNKTVKGMPFRRIIGIAFVRPNNEYALHATKGYRWRRLPPNGNALLAALIGRVQ
jgi:hypothetical protein